MQRERERERERERIPNRLHTVSTELDREAQEVFIPPKLVLHSLMEFSPICVQIGILTLQRDPVWIPRLFLPVVSGLTSTLSHGL